MLDLREHAVEHAAHLALLLLLAARQLTLGLPHRLLKLPLLARLPARGVAACARGAAAPAPREWRAHCHAPAMASSLPIWLLHWLRRHGLLRHRVVRRPPLNLV